MFLKTIVAGCVVLLLGCVQVYVVTHELSKEYLLNRGAIFDPKYSEISTNGVLFFIESGYYKKETKSLIIYLNYDALQENSISIDHVELLSSGRLVSDIKVIDNFVERNENSNGLNYINGGARLKFSISDPKTILKQHFVLRVNLSNIEKDGTEYSIEFKLNIDRLYVSPT